FFSSRRRHTRWPRDWSSDVCSSDLGQQRERTRGPKRLLLLDVLNVEAEAGPITEVARDLIALVMRRDVYPTNTSVRKLPHEELEQRMIPNRQHRLRNPFRQRPQTPSIAARHDDGAQRKLEFSGEIAQERQIHHH